MLRGIAFLLAMLLSSAAPAQPGQSCSQEEVGNAAAAATAVEDWEGMYDTFHRFSHCKGTAVSEAFSQSIGRILASRWDELHDLEHFAEANRTFRAFVVQHIDGTISAADLRRIVEHVKSCPGHARPICREIESRSRYALHLKE